MCLPEEPACSGDSSLRVAVGARPFPKCEAPSSYILSLNRYFHLHIISTDSLFHIYYKYFHSIIYLPFFDICILYLHGYPHGLILHCIHILPKTWIHSITLTQSNNTTWITSLWFFSSAWLWVWMVCHPLIGISLLFTSILFLLLVLYSLLSSAFSLCTFHL